MMEGMLEKAVRLAFEKHEGQVRKGTNIPYIVHPMEVMKLLKEMNADDNLLVAGLLHDVVEDAGVTVGEIKQLFGEDVAKLVAGHSEDKAKTWQERKKEDIRAATEGDVRLKMLVLADKLSNLRSLYFDYRKLGEAVWDRFNAPVTQQTWYYSKMIDALDVLQEYPNTEPLYWEMSGLFKDIFVSFYYEEDMDRMYQRCLSGEGYFLEHGNPQWRLFTEPLPEGVRKLGRKLAERIEENWADDFFDVIRKDKQDGNYLLYATAQKYVSIELKDEKLCFVCEERRKQQEDAEGKIRDNQIYKLSEFETSKFFYALRQQYVLWHPVEKMLEQEFGVENATSRFEAFCNQARISFDYYVL